MEEMEKKLRKISEIVVISRVKMMTSQLWSKCSVRNQVNKSIAVPLPPSPPPPLPPGRKKELKRKKFNCGKKRGIVQESKNAKDLKLHTLTRPEPCLFMNIYLMPLTHCLRASAQKYLLHEWMECDRESTRD